MFRHTAIAFLLLCLGCAARKAAGPPADPPAPAARPSAVPAMQPQKQFHVPLPGPGWKVMSKKEALLHGPPAMLVLVNDEAHSYIRFDAVPAERGSPTMLALNASDKLEEKGVRPSNIDFSDPAGDRASFTFVADQGDNKVSGKVEMFRLEGDTKVVFAATGVWPATADAEMTAVFDATIERANVR